MNRILIIVVTAMAFLAASCGKKMEKTAEGKVIKATVSMLAGKATILREGAPAPIAATPNMQLLPADMILTGDQSKLNIILENSGVIQIGPNSRVVLSSLYIKDGAADQKLSVRAGQVILGLKKLQKDAVFNVETPTAIAGVRGTSFMVNVQNSDANSAFPYFVKMEQARDIRTKVAVLSGAVEFIDAKDEKKSVLITQLRQAILEGDDFDNIKLMNIDRISLDQLNELRGFAELGKLKMKEISEEIGQVDPEIRQVLGTSLESKAGIKKAGTLDADEESKLKDASTKQQEIEKVNVKQKKEGKYLDDQGKW
jgi:hypothetical protein